MTKRETKANNLTAAQIYERSARRPPDSAIAPPNSGGTLPMQCDAKGLLWLVHCWLRGRLPPEDQEFLETAMQEYGRACVAEAGKAEQPD